MLFHMVMPYPLYRMQRARREAIEALVFPHSPGSVLPLHMLPRQLPGATTNYSYN